jgi:hypothetical protein
MFLINLFPSFISYYFSLIELTVILSIIKSYGMIIGGLITISYIVEICFIIKMITVYNKTNPIILILLLGNLFYSSFIIFFNYGFISYSVLPIN